jgi:hypothetical protein
MKPGAAGQTVFRRAIRGASTRLLHRGNGHRRAQTLGQRLSQTRPKRQRIRQRACKAIQAMTVDERISRYLARFPPAVSGCGGGVCEFTVGDQATEPGSTFLHQIEWTGKPKPKHIAEYRQWILATIQTLCERWNKSILYALSPNPHSTELWSFRAGSSTKTRRKVALRTVMKGSPRGFPHFFT